MRMIVLIAVAVTVIGCEQAPCDALCQQNRAILGAAMLSRPQPQPVPFYAMPTNQPQRLQSNCFWAGNMLVCN